MDLLGTDEVLICYYKDIMVFTGIKILFFKKSAKNLIVTNLNSKCFIFPIFPF